MIKTSMLDYSLSDVTRIRDAVGKILVNAELPTSYVDSLPDKGTQETISRAETFIIVEDVPRGKGMHSMDLNRPLRQWLRDNVEVARDYLARSEPIRYEVERLQDELVQKLELEDIEWDCDWNLLHRRGALESLDILVKNHLETLRSILKNRTLVFGRQSGVSLSGKVILFSGEVRHNWFNAIQRVPRDEILLSAIPLVEKALSQQLRGIQIVKRDDQAVTLVDEYRKHLRSLITRVSDYLSRQSFPTFWPESLSDYQLCVESESSPLMLSPSGQFVVPASCPGFVLVRFLSANLEESKMKMLTSEAREVEETRLIIDSIKELGLIQIERGESLTSDAMISCCKRLLELAPVIRHLTHGNHLVVARFYSVLADGVICIPWNFRLD